jgi:beta-aspartyl-peptidase (threonine type)
MKLRCVPAICLLLAGTANAADVAIAIHGGAGTITRAEMTPEREQAYREKLEQAVRSGYAVLQDGHSSVLAVQAAINVLEDSPLFNAGKGAVFNAAGQNELDASVMDGSNLQAGAVAAVHRIRNPIDLAIEVMNHSKHVMMMGDGAEEFARERGLTFVEPSYFRTEHRWQQLQKKQAEETAGIDRPQDFFSTVGAVARDSRGNLAAGTSTGGMTNKRFGRVGDSPIIGAGTYANNDGCAVSATGHGEFFIRFVVAYEICRRVADGASVAEAGDAMIHEVLQAAGATGGVIIMGPDGAVAMPHNTPGMYRASIDTSGQLFIGIYGDDS